MGDGFDSELIRETTTRVYKYLIKHGANPEDAKDITQDALYKSVKYIDSIDPQKYSAWLFKVALNGYYDLCRRDQKRARIPIETIYDDTNTPETVFLQAENQERMKRALAKLPEIQRQLLLLKYAQGLSYEEIARLQGMKVDKVRTYLYRARQNMNKYLGRFENE